MPLLFGPLRLLDRFLLSLGLPHAGQVTGGPVLLLMLYIAACIAAIAWIAF